MIWLSQYLDMLMIYKVHAHVLFVFTKVQQSAVVYSCLSVYLKGAVCRSVFSFFSYNLKPPNKFGSLPGAELPQCSLPLQKTNRPLNENQ